MKEFVGENAVRDLFDIIAENYVSREEIEKRSKVFIFDAGEIYYVFIGKLEEIKTANKIVNQIMQQKRGTLANWTAKNPVLKAGEIGFVTDKGMFKASTARQAM